MEGVLLLKKIVVRAHCLTCACKGTNLRAKKFLHPCGGTEGGTNYKNIK